MNQLEKIEKSLELFNEGKTYTEVMVIAKEWD